MAKKPENLRDTMQAAKQIAEIEWSRVLTAAYVEAGKLMSAALTKAVIEIDKAKARDRACELRACRSGRPAKRRAGETIDDGCWSVNICQGCFDALGLTCDGDDLPAAPEIKRRLAGLPVVTQ